MWPGGWGEAGDAAPNIGPNINPGTGRVRSQGRYEVVPAPARADGCGAGEEGDRSGGSLLSAVCAPVS